MLLKLWSSGQRDQRLLQIHRGDVAQIATHRSAPAQRRKLKEPTRPFI
jgi:hypothetical protein